MTARNLACVLNNMRRDVSPEAIDAVLPQTQCGLCTYAGCMPYAEAIVNDNAAINLCPPGGVAGLQAIAKLVAEDASPFIAAMEKSAKLPLVAVIREAECIGCTKCIQACPVDAILGAGKLMHTVISAECTGCELCIAPCPVDCIDLLTLPERDEQERQKRADLARNRYQKHQKRLSEETIIAHQAIRKPLLDSHNQEKKAYIQQAIQRARLKKTALATSGS